uniref:Uncharacterized protein n=1 Tax=Rhizophora mucronata TaxID=61149 RepID=A0A2P2ISN8_RHIMU
MILSFLVQFKVSLSERHHRTKKLKKKRNFCCQIHVYVNCICLSNSTGYLLSVVDYRK